VLFGDVYGSSQSCAPSVPSVSCSGRPLFSIQCTPPSGCDHCMWRGTRAVRPARLGQLSLNSQPIGWMDQAAPGSERSRTPAAPVQTALRSDRPGCVRVADDVHIPGAYASPPASQYDRAPPQPYFWPVEQQTLSPRAVRRALRPRMRSCKASLHFGICPRPRAMTG